MAQSRSKPGGEAHPEKNSLSPPDEIRLLAFKIVIQKGKILKIKP